jgi:3-oxoacyl-[acyl-carrier protein] reductase
VTGASCGLGKASAAALAAEGTSVVLNARGAEHLAATARELEAKGATVVAELGDFADPDTPGRLVDLAIERFGRLDIVVPNAGGPPPGRALEVDDDGLHAALEANLLASIRLARAAVPHMRAGAWGRVCCITSYTVVQPLPTLALSNVARTGLWAWAKTAAADLAGEGSGITVNLVCPGPHATDRMRELTGSAHGGAAMPMGDPADLGRVVAFMCSAHTGFLNGAAVVVDGGATLAL